MTFKLIDSHAHLTNKDLLLDIEAILDRAKENHVSSIINICTDIESLNQGLKLKEKYPWIYNTAATTPHDADTEGDLVFPFIEEIAKKKLLVAIGETGLDYYYYKETAETQKKLFKRYLKLALECNLPVVIHCRDAFKDFFEILDQEYVVNGIHAKGVLHCFTGTLEEAHEVIKRGWYLSLSGIVTYKKSDALREVAKIVPLNQLLIETDSPYLAPQKRRGKVNEPAFIKETAQLIADVKGISLEELADATYQNAKNLFNL